MKIGFALTYDEYAESRGSNSKRPAGSPTIGILGAIIAASAACLFFGGEILIRSPFDFHNIGFKILLFGALCALSLPAAWRWRRRRDRNLSEAPVLADFEHIAKDKQRTFEANESGWKFQMEYGDDLRPWNSLASFREGDKILVLSTKGDVYVLPKGSLSEEQIAELKTWSRNSMESQAANTIVRVKAFPTAWGYTLSASSQVWQYQVTGLFLLFGVLGSSMWMLWDQFSHLGQPGSEQEGQIIAILMVLSSLWFLLRPLSVYNAYKDLAKDAPEMIMIYTPDAILVEGPKSISLLNYDRFRRFVESRGAFLLYYSDKEFSMFPKQGIPDNQVKEIRRLLETRFQMKS
jgi:membrane protein implicated in regulation of membrane protease activity